MTELLTNRSANNFDFIRLMAAAFVLAGHSSDVLLNQPLSPDPGKILFGFSLQSLGVIIFFVISGYLVTGSFENRKSWLTFFFNRILRVFPALIVVIVLTVFILGPLLTTVDLEYYFTSQKTRSYLQNMTLYRMYYYLPGVFENNPIKGSVNASLWTLPYEFTCYLYIAVAGIIPFLSGKWVSLMLFIGYFVVYLFFESFLNNVVIPVLGIDFKTFFIPFLYFLSGSLYFKFRNLIPLNLTGFILSSIIITLIQTGLLHHQFMVLVIPYLVLLLAFTRKWNFNRITRYGDFSYGLYLYAFPVQQLIVYFAPEINGLLIMMLLSLIFTLPFAIASWFLIERPALALKSRFAYI